MATTKPDDRVAEAAWRVLDRIYIFGLAATDAMADDLNRLEAALGGRAARYAAKESQPRETEAPSLPSDEQLLDAYVAACNRESELDDADLSPKNIRAGIAAAMRGALLGKAVTP